MQTTSPPLGPSAPALPTQSWRDRLKITRSGVFSILFVLFGLWALIAAPQSYSPETVTGLTFGSGLPRVEVPTLSFVTVAGWLFLLGGLVGLAASFISGGSPVVVDERKPQATVLDRVARFWLIVNGILIIPTILIIAAANNSTNVTVMLQVSVRLATPIALGALAGIWCERSGVVNIAIEGMMLTGACFGFVALTIFAEMMPTATAIWLGVLVAVLSGGAMALLHAWLSITFRTDQIVSGTVINILAVGITSFLRRE